MQFGMTNATLVIHDLYGRNVTPMNINCSNNKFYMSELFY